MKLSFASSILLWTTFSVSPLAEAHLRGGNGDVETLEIKNEASSKIISELKLSDDSTCLSIKDEDKCNVASDSNGVECVWCKCAAVPSECVSVEQSKALPDGVFDCATRNDTDVSSTASTATSVVSSMLKTDTAHGDKYDASKLTFTLEDGEVDRNLCDPKSKSYSGYVDIEGSKYDADGEDKHLYYWFFEKRSASIDTSTEELKMAMEEIPLVLWLTGGPGCSSTLALLTENGPCSVTDDGKSTNINPYSWTETAHMLYLDQPAGVGYSYGAENDYNEEMISEDAAWFLQHFFEKHPEYRKNPVFIVGESYGGHYAPAIAHKVWTKNNNTEDKSWNKINLSGVAIGNGLTNPYVQYQYYAEMAYNNSHGIKVVSEEVYEGMKKGVETCVKLIEECNKGDSILNKFACQSAFVACNVAETSPYQVTGLNPYDIRKKCEHPPLCYDFTPITSWLNSESTKAALHVKAETKWTTCNMGINLKFHSDW